MSEIAAALTAVQPLLDAGKTLATLADPADDLIDISGQLGEIVITLHSVESGLHKAHDAQLEARTKIEWREIDRRERAAALRTVKRAIIDLAAWAEAVEAEQAQSAG